MMKNGRRYYRTKDLKPYVVVGEQTITPTGMRLVHRYHVLAELGKEENTTLVFFGLDMNTTRDWATTEKMAVANKIKLLENEIVMLTQRL